jgi:hypothetical protein
MYTCLPHATQNQPWGSPPHPSEGDVANSSWRRPYQSSVSIKNNPHYQIHSIAVRQARGVCDRDIGFRSWQLGTCGLNIVRSSGISFSEVEAWGPLPGAAQPCRNEPVTGCITKCGRVTWSMFPCHHSPRSKLRQRIMFIRCSYVQAVLSLYKMTQPGLFLSPCFDISSF